MEVRRITTLAIEILKTVNELNPLFMKTIFKTNSIIRSFDLLVKNCNNEKYGSKCLMALEPKICNALPKNVKKETSVTIVHCLIIQVKITAF